MSDLTELSVCTDCILVIANGDCGENTEQHGNAMERQHPDSFFLFGGDELGFSYWYCEGCGSNLGGDRFSAYVESL